MIDARGQWAGGDQVESVAYALSCDTTVVYTSARTRAAFIFVTVGQEGTPPVIAILCWVDAVLVLPALAAAATGQAKRSIFGTMVVTFTGTRARTDAALANIFAATGFAAQLWFRDAAEVTADL